MRTPSQQIWQHSLVLLGRQMYSRKKLEEKLLKKFPAEQKNIHQVLQMLEKQNYLNDTLYAEEFTRMRLSTAPRGKFLLEKELEKKGITRATAQAVLGTLSETEELNGAQKIAHRKILILSQKGTREQQELRLFRFLVSRGFRLELARHVARQALDSITESS